ncbi:hypothetical protein A2U01_0001264 [Trifolium medium]|uniref:Uncharacterized protein n=1 Tax=Trifolium medium TaxID=97028 RepID=A0A392LZT8_9FABA|nr:hypothetical protein [Trifolium medium]
MSFKKEDLMNTILGDRLPKTVMFTVYVKDVRYGEIDPEFAFRYFHELAEHWQVYANNEMQLLTWDQCIHRPRLLGGWNEIREKFECLQEEIPLFHSLSIKEVKEPFAFEIVISNEEDSTRELFLDQLVGEHITAYHDDLTLEGPVAEPIFSRIIKSVGPDNYNKFEVDAWMQFCRENSFSNGDIMKFTFYDIEKCNIVDVDWCGNIYDIN